jgi:thymidylate synthase
MITFKGTTFADCYQASLIGLQCEGAQNEARGTKSKELLNVALVVEDPTSCLYSNQARGSQIQYIAAEFLWYYMGRNDVQFISKWAKFWQSIQNPDGTANSAYGHLIFKTKNPHNMCQYEWAIGSLLSDKNTRQAIMHFNLPDHQYPDNKDFVCTMYVNCHIRDNKFHMSTFMRSNDAIWGTPTDVVFFCSLQMQMYSHLKQLYSDLELGTYTHIANSYHVYDRHYDLLTKMLDSEFVPVQMPHVINDLIEITGEPTQNFKILFDELTSESSKDIIIFQENDLFLWIYNNINQRGK